MVVYRLYMYHYLRLVTHISIVDIAIYNASSFIVMHPCSMDGQFLSKFLSA